MFCFLYAVTTSIPLGFSGFTFAHFKAMEMTEFSLTVLRGSSYRGGLLCRIWNAILNHRQTSGTSSVQKVNASEGEHEMEISANERYIPNT